MNHLFRSLLKPLTGVGVIGTFSHLTFKTENKHLKMAYSGVAAQVVSDIIFHPIDLININTKYNFQNKTNSVDTFKKVYKQYGFRGFYRGLDVLILSSAIYGFAYYTIYKYVKESILNAYKGDDEMNFVAYTLASISGELILIFYYPFDMIKTRILSFSVSYKNLYQGLKEIIDKTSVTKSIRNLYSGFIPTTILHSSWSMILLVSFEMCRDYIAKRKGILSSEVMGWDYFFASCFSGVVTASFTNVMEVYTIQKQVHGDSVTTKSFMKSQFFYAMRSGIGIRMFYGIFYTIVLLENINMFGRFFGIHL